MCLSSERLKDLRLFILPKRGLKNMLPMPEKKFDNRGLFNLLHRGRDKIRPRMKSDKLRQEW